MIAIIKSVTSLGIRYIDKSGSEGYIDFKQCNNNYIQYRTRIESLSDERVIDLRDNDKCVGQRDICAKPRYIEFFTKPFTKLEFAESEDKSNAEEAFSTLQNEITSVGWTTFDLS